MTKVAADYGVTGTALKKTCDRHHIPTPERGYWASRFFALAETQGHLPKATEDGLVLIVENESIAFGLEEQPEKTLHQPTPSELKRRDERARWGYATDPWPKYDQVPSGRLAIVIHANPYSGLRRTYSDGKTQALERMLPDILAGFVGHAAYMSERRREADERQRRHREAEVQRQREEAFNSREKRRMEFVDAVHEQLIQRDKLTAVLRHFENAISEDAARVSTVTTWIRQRLKQIDALISPHFLDISARSSKVDFAEPDPGHEAERGSFYYSPPITLQLWSIDDAKGLATSCSPLEWIDALALPSEGGETS